MSEHSTSELRPAPPIVHKDQHFRLGQIAQQKEIRPDDYKFHYIYHRGEWPDNKNQENILYKI